jgi:hypothetical protein
MMEDIAVLNKSEVKNRRDLSTNYYGTRLTPKREHTSPNTNDLLIEGGENFFHYLNWHGLTNESKMLVLSAKKHFYYDCDDLKGVTTLINLKKLNLIAHLDSFINTVCQVASPKTNFIGCFSDRKSCTRDGLGSKMYKKFINFLDLRIDNEIDNKDVKRLLEKNGFKVIDMTEINGLMYFRAQNIYKIS